MLHNKKHWCNLLISPVLLYWMETREEASFIINEDIRQYFDGIDNGHFITLCCVHAMEQHSIIATKTWAKQLKVGVGCDEWNGTLGMIN